MDSDLNRTDIFGAPSLGIAAALLLTGAAIFVLPHSAPVRAPAPSAPVTATAEPAPVSPAFAQEQGMTPRELMARWEPLIGQASKKYNVPADWIRAVMARESGGRTMLGETMPMVSSAGAMGLMQVMPATYAEKRAELGLGDDPFNPRDNILAGTAYLKWLHGKYGYPAMFAAYNDGPGNLEDHLFKGRALPTETRLYVAAIGKSLGVDISGLNNVSLTKPDGSAVAIDAVKVSAIHAAAPGEYAPGVSTVVSIGKTHQGVREDFAQVAALLRSHGAKV